LSELLEPEWPQETGLLVLREWRALLLVRRRAQVSRSERNLVLR
jgi:hypothetical protein